jgi:hypothetical protein
MVAFKGNRYRHGGAVPEPSGKSAPQPEAAALVAPPAAPEGEKSELQKQLEALQRAEEIARQRTEAARLHHAQPAAELSDAKKRWLNANAAALQEIGSAQQVLNLAHQEAMRAALRTTRQNTSSIWAERSPQRPRRWLSMWCPNLR